MMVVACLRRRKCWIVGSNSSSSLEEVYTAQTRFKNGKAEGSDGMPAQIWKHGGMSLTHHLFNLIETIWTTGYLAQEG